MLSEKIISQIIQEQYDNQGTCIECGGQYFHQPGCLRGAGLSSEELYKRLTERATMLKPMPTKCFDCNSEATGTVWIAFHNSKIVATATPSCENCSTKYYTDRPSGYIPGVITNNTIEVFRILKDVI